MKTDIFWNGIVSLFFIIFALLIGCKEEEMVSTPPAAVFTIEPQAGVPSTIFNFDASGSYDNEDAQGDLKVRWDWENDGIWETPFSTVKTETHQYAQEGTYSVKLEVIDKNEVSGSDTAKVFVTNGEEGEPCPETPTIEYEGKVYNTVLIGDQCWMRENLNVGVYINIYEQFQEDNGILEKFCYDDLESNCDTYGGIYMLGEIMNYTYQEGTRGICPEGWHVPSHEDWCILTQYIDNTIDCDSSGWIGNDVGIKMKSKSGWKLNGNGSNITGFSALPAGGWGSDNGYVLKGEMTFFWESLTGYWSSYWSLSNQHENIWYGSSIGGVYLSARCIKD